MEKILLIIIVALFNINCKAQKNDTTMINNFDFNSYVDMYRSTKKGSRYYKSDSSFFYGYGGKEPVIYEYPKKSFIEIYMKFYESGKLHIKGYWLGDVKIGIWRAYDEQGYQIEELDEDKKFGKIKPDDILQFLEKEGFINLKTGEGRYDKYGFDRFMFNYTRSSTEKKLFKNNFIPSIWKIVICSRIEVQLNEVVKYEINGETGEVISKTTEQVQVII